MANPQVKMITNFGDITFELFPEFAPKAVENFIGLSKNGYYDGFIFHRVIRDFIIVFFYNITFQIINFLVVQNDNISIFLFLCILFLYI